MKSNLINHASLHTIHAIYNTDVEISLISFFYSPFLNETFNFLILIFILRNYRKSVDTVSEVLDYPIVGQVGIHSISSFDHASIRVVPVLSLKLQAEERHLNPKSEPNCVCAELSPGKVNEGSGPIAF